MTNKIELADLAQLMFWLGPSMVLLYLQRGSTLRWQRMGRLKQWRSDHGGIFATVSRACGWLFLGIVGSFAAEVAFFLAFHATVPRLVADAPARLHLWFSLFPFATYFPLLPCWVWRRSHA